MDMNESEPVAGVAAPQVEIPTTTPRKRWRKSSIVLVSAAGAALALASAATGIIATAQIVTAASRIATGADFGRTGSGAAMSGGTASGDTASGGGAFAHRWRGSGNYGETPASNAASSSGTAATTARETGVVTIDTELNYQGEEAAGTGIILTSSGEILTNNHVIDGATSIKVTVIATGAVYPAVVVGTDATSDVSVLQLEGASGLSTATTDAASQVAVSDDIVAVGNAGGTGNLTAASGAVTAVDQAITASSDDSSSSENLTGLIETNADVVPGDSGGPLYNADGDVVGIDTAASSGSSTVAGYAIPIGTALSIAHLIAAGDGTSAITIGYPAFLGVEIATTANATAGALVGGTIPGEPAAEAGLAAGDTITAVNASPVSSASQLSELLKGYRPGDSVTITWTDSAGAANSAILVLTQGPAN